MTTRAHPIREFMTLAPQYVPSRVSVAEARALMAKLGIGHLPIVDAGALVGLLSAHDVQVASRLGSDVEALSVGQLMSGDPYTATPDVEITRVAREMAQGHVECAVITERERVVGILTSTDVLSLLADAASATVALIAPTRLPSAIKRRIEAEHTFLRQKLDQVEALAERALREEPVEQELFASARELYRRLLEHIELEDALLAPTLPADSEGPQGARGFLHKHHEQRIQLGMGLAMVDVGDTEHLAESLLLLSHSVRVDMKQEEDTVLSSRMLDDSIVEADMNAG
jgi:acetoin utilization protein AcuB